jgi:hypothetical protein
MEEKPESAIDIELHQSLERAAYWRSESERPETGDTTYRAFVEVMTYRRQIARNMLREQGENKYSVLKDHFNYCNDQIKKLLGL